METVDRKVLRPGERDAPRVERVGDVWHIRSMGVARQLLRAQDATTQAGFSCEEIPENRIVRPPILFLDGERHRTQRSKTARFFAPKTVSTRYRELMDDRSSALIAEARRQGTFRLDDLAFRYAVEVAGHVVGLTDSAVGPMARRLSRFFEMPTSADLAASGRLRATLARFAAFPPMLSFYLHDVRPAIRARRRQPAEDVVTHLIAEGYSGAEILIECITYGAAGMVTTREFISMATWHLLDRPALRERYVVADEKERQAILLEILRLEPIVGHLYRRAQVDVELTDGDETYSIRAGDLCDLYIRATNTDAEVVGADPLAVCPERPLPKGVSPEVQAFGDGPHKCPGNALAIAETDMLLTKLLKLDVDIIQRPTIGWDDLIAGYSLRDFKLRLRG